MGAERGKVSKIELGDDPDERNRRIDELTTTVRSEWFNVCSQGGTSRYPYGDEYKPGACIDKEKLDSQRDRARAACDTANNECHGMRSPYDQVFDMSGSTEQCLNIWFSSGCVVHGGRAFEPSRLSCKESVGLQHEKSLNGVRCCADAVLSTGDVR